MYTVILSTPDGDKKFTQVTGFTVWRDDAGFRSEYYGKEHSLVFAGHYSIKFDETGILSIGELNITV